MLYSERMKHQMTVLLMAGLSAASCTPYQQQGAAVGGVTGAAVGAIAGGSGTSTAQGALLGAGIGATAAAMQESSRNQNSGNNDPSRAPRRNDYPYAERTSTPGEVLSPYSPYNVMDVHGLRSGSLARDPSCGKMFRVP
jgi:hypothetical protein